MEELDTPIIGFRCWLIELEKPILKSVAMIDIWPQHTFKAECHTSHGDDPNHIIPGNDSCRCGIYARTSLAGLSEEYGYYPCYGSWQWRSPPKEQYMVQGVILQWGRILRGDKVTRSEYAQIVCLTESKDLWTAKAGINDPSIVSEELRQRRSETIDMIQETYNLPMVPADSVNMYASEFGQLAA